MTVLELIQSSSRSGFFKIGHLWRTLNGFQQVGGGKNEFHVEMQTRTKEVPSCFQSSFGSRGRRVEIAESLDVVLNTNGAN